jgi:hypothetical protein
MLTVERLRDVLTYDPETGIFRWKVTNSNRAPAGSVAGNLSHGCRQIFIDGKMYKASRLAWLYVRGEWPSDFVDHVNMVKDDDRFCNLRNATNGQNQANRRVLRNNQLGVKGVRVQRRTGKYEAQITVKGKQIFLGTYDVLEAAHAAYAEAARKYHGEFARPA